MKAVAIASDHAGYALKEMLKGDIAALGFSVKDLGTDSEKSVDYPDFAHALADFLSHHKNDFGILICGSGIGMSIAANRHKHIRAALCHNGLEAGLTRKHNNANVLCLGARIIGSEVAKDITKQFLTTEFEGGRHQVRIDKIGGKDA